MKISDLDLNVTDNSAKEFAEELLIQLRIYRDSFDTHAMSPTHQTNLIGQKNMLQDIINYIQVIAPTH